MVLLIALIVSIIYVLLSNFIKYGFSNDTFKIIINQIFMLRGLYFLLFFISICLYIMNQIDNVSKWGIIPFIMCGICGMLCMYEKTRKIGYYSFIIIFIGTFLVGLPTIGLISQYNRGETIELSSIVFLSIIYIVIIIIIIKNIRNNKKK